MPNPAVKQGRFHALNRKSYTSFPVKNKCWKHCPVDRECHPHHADTCVSMYVPEWWRITFYLF